MDAKVMKAYIGNVWAEEAIRLARSLEFPVTIIHATGYTPEWGEEPTLVLEHMGSNPMAFQAFIGRLLRESGEEAALVTVDGRDPRLYDKDGIWTKL